MFVLHYKTRRLLCRLAFVLFCLAPTTAVLVWAGWTSTSAHVDACRGQIEERLQTAAKLAGTTHPRPGVTVYEGLELLDPRTRQRHAYLPRLEATTSGGQLELLATGPEIERRGLPHLQTLLDQPRRDTSAVSLRAGSLIVREATQDLKLRDVRLRATRTTDGDEIELHFHLLTEPSTSLRLRLVQDPESRRTRLIELETGDSKLPCRLAVPLVPWLAQLGATASFQGVLQLTHDNQGWHGDLQGRLEQIDLQRALADNLSHRLDGLADLHIARARIVQSRLSEISGSVSAGPGLIGPSLRLAAAEALELTAAPVALAPHGVLEYEQLAFDFTLDARGIYLMGRCRNHPAGALLSDRSQILLGQPRRQPQSVSDLIRALVPPGSESVPATRETAWLLKFLPVEPRR